MTVLLLLALCVLPAPAAWAGNTWHFTDVTALAGVSYQHGWTNGDFGPAAVAVGGVAAGDYDRDGWVDLYAVRGDIGPNLLFRNLGNGSFEEVGAVAGVARVGLGAGATFADVDGDGWLDLLVVGIGLVQGDPMQPILFRNRGDGTFEDVSAASGLLVHRDCVSTAFGDSDRDGDLDLFIAQWGDNTPPRSSEHFWENQGDGTFVDASIESGIDPTYRVAGTQEVASLAFTPNFADIDNDGWPDLLVAGDFRMSQVFLNDGDGTFTNVTDATISDENGMGAAVADVDGDGNLDWFVSSIFDPNGIIESNWYGSGNRYYRGLGNGHFEDRTSAAGVRHGFWGWGSTFADLDNDGDFDLVHVNGWRRIDPDAFEFHDDPTRIFINEGNATFVDRAGELGVADTRQGRGLVAFDYDRDGDLDLFIANNQEGSVLLRNDGGDVNRFLAVRLAGLPPNTEAIGARVYVTVAGTTRFQEMRAGNNYLSQDPAILHFGLAQAATAQVRVRWLGGAETDLGDVAADQELVVSQGPTTTSTTTTTLPNCVVPGPGHLCVPGGGKPRTDCLLEWRLRATNGDAGAPVVVECRDGDAACDVDAAAGSCAVQVAFCLANADPALTKCTARDVASLTVRKPGVRGSEEDRALRAALIDAIAEAFALGESGAVFTGRNVCTSPVDVPVAVRAKRGKLRPGKRSLRATAAAVGGGRDADALRLVCLPAIPAS